MFCRKLVCFIRIPCLATALCSATLADHNGPVGIIPDNVLNALVGTFPDDGGPITIVANETVHSAGFDFYSLSGGLIPIEGNDPTPFTFLLSNTPNQVAFGNLGSTVTFAEGTETELSFGVAPGTDDVEAAWGWGPTPVPLTVVPESLFNEGNPIGGGNQNPIVNPPVIPPPVVVPPVVVPPVVVPPVVVPPVVTPPVVVPPIVEPPVVGSNALIGTFPEDGGPITIVANETVDAAGLDFISQSGGLIPAEGTDGAPPFTFFLANNPNQVTYGNLGSSVTFAEGTETELSIGVVAGTDDIQAAWGDGATPVAFTVVSEALLDEDNLISGGNGGNGMDPVTPSEPEMPGGGGMQDPAAVPEPSSLMVWMTLGLMVAFQRWRTGFRTRDL